MACWSDGLHNERLIDKVGRSAIGAPPANPINKSTGRQEMARSKKFRLPKVINVTPEMAAAWLEKNTHNRDIRQADINQYARDMKNGDWQLTHHGVAFNCEDVLIDGQHRLWAVIESGATVPMLVTYGLPIEVQLVIDDNFQRGSKDFLTLTDKFGRVTATECAVLKRMLKGVGGWARLSHPEELSAFGLHLAAVRFSLSAFQTKVARVTSASVLAVVARAYYSPYDKADILAFCEVMHSGICQNKKLKPALLLREALMRGSKGKSWHPSEVYKKTQAVLLAYLEGRKLSLVAGVERELFLLPRERHLGTKTATTKYRTRKMRIVEALKRIGPGATAKQVSEGIGISSNAVRDILRKLHDAGIVDRDSSDLTSRWSVSK